MADGASEGRKLSATDSLMWRIESDPVLRSPILVIALLDRAPQRRRLEASVEHACGELRGLRQRIVAPPLGVGRAEWREDPHFAIENHIRWVRTPKPGLDALVELAEPDAVAAFDPERPLWALTIVEGLGGGQAAFVLRFHHSITDGVGGLQLAERLFDTSRRPSTKRAHRPGTPTPAAGRPLLARVAEGVSGAARLAADTARHPGALTELTGSSLRLARSVGRYTAPAPPSRSSLLVDRGIDRRLHVFELPIAALQGAAAATGTTVNDIFLAVVGGAFEAYHREQGVEVPTMNVTVPVNRRTADDAAGGNRFVPTRFVVPIDDPELVNRAKIAGSLVRSWREEPALGLSDLLAGGLGLLPSGVLSRFFGSLLRTIDIDISNLRGIEKTLYIAGARIDRMWAFAPPAGAALSVTLLSHGPTACVGVSCDRAAVDDPELMNRCIETGFAEAAALAERAGEAGNS